MTEKAGMFLGRPARLLDEADTILSVDLNEAAGRSARLAGFHTACETDPQTGITLDTCRRSHRDRTPFIACIKHGPDE